jgi:aminoglycoside phosphotransferase family enzyme/predicted kinase
MEPSRLIEELSRPAAYPAGVERVEVRQTHVSAVFLAGRHAYKVKKPVEFGFLDFRTLERRRHFCEEEVRLNRRLAPAVYLGVVPITRGADGLKVEGDGAAVEWAVKMVRLPEEATLRERLLRGEVGAARLEDLARRLAAFHAAAEGGGPVASFGRFTVVAGNARENLEQPAAAVGVTVSAAVFERLRALTEGALARLRPLIESRAARGVPRDTHGDLRLSHVYLFPERAPPDDVVVIDCIEFNERFRYADPVADVAFLYMDLVRAGRRDLAEAFAAAYFTAAADGEGRALLPFYTAYRAAVRAKVEGLRAAEAEVPADERAAAQARARGHWLLALGELEASGRRPGLVLVSGLPGSGKSTLARGLAERSGFAVVRSDVVRKELAGGAAGREDIYTPEWTERTYAECLRRAEGLLWEGKRVLVDATFREEERRRTFLEAATRLGVPGLLLVCRARPEVVRERLAARRGDVSDANWRVYLELAAQWQPPGTPTRSAWHEIDTGGEREQALAAALRALAEAGLEGEHRVA